MKPEKLERAAKWVVCVVGSLIMTGLCWYAFRYTQYMYLQSAEIPTNIHDSMSQNLLILAAAAAVTALLYLLERRGSERLCRGLMYGTLILAMAWVAAAGLWWITAMDHTPEGDQAYVYAGASYFIEGQYSFVGGYFSDYPQNLSLTALVELLFRVVGTYNYYACQVVCVGFAVGIVGMGFLVIRQLTKSAVVPVAYHLTMLFCLPMIFYTSWVYGDLPSTFFILASAWALLRYEKSGKRRWLALLVASVTMAYLVRKNSLIMIVALLLVGGVHSLTRRDKRMAFSLVLCVLVPMLMFRGIVKIYEIRSGMTVADGVSYVSYLAMGTEEVDGKYGWYTEYCKEVLREYDNNTSLAAQASWADLKENLENFAQNPSYAVTFFREKILSQWNMPTYQSLYFGYKLGSDVVLEPTDLTYLLSSAYFTRVINLCDRLQMVVYAGMLLYFLLGIRRGRGILHSLLAVTIIGGFLFSVIWEAKARYCLPYYLFMFPMAAVGWRIGLEQAMRLIRRLRRGKKEDNVIPFREAA